MTEEAWRQRLLGVQVAGRLPSVVAGVVRGGRLVWSGAAGLESTTPETAFRIGSITKTMTAVAVLQLREEGRLDLDDPLGRHLDGAPYAATTLRRLLSHTAGLQSEPAGPWWERSPGVDRATLFERNDGSGAVAAPGEWFHYSNLGYGLLGELVATLRGEPWWDVVRDRVLAPLGMGRTTYAPGAPHAQGYSVDHFAGTLTEEPHTDTGAMAPAGQLWSTVADLARWATFLVEGHPGVLAREVLAEMAEPVTPEALHGSSYGLGLQLVPVGDRWLVGHGGSMPGFVASLFVDPQTHEGVVVLANATTGLASGVVPAQVLTGVGLPAAVRPWRPTDRLPDGVRDLLGTWFWGNTAMGLAWFDGHLRLRSLSAPWSAPGDDFVVSDDGRLLGVSGYHRGETLRVHRRPDGGVSHLECATFVYTRTPYDPAVPVPGGHPAPG